MKVDNPSRMKLPLLLWSGGLDSTYLLWCRLANGQAVDVLYINLDNNKENSELEQKAIKKLKTIFKKACLPAGIRKEYEYVVPTKTSIVVTLPQAVIWNDGILWNYNPQEHESVELSYVQGDDFWHYRDRIASYQKIMFQAHIKNIPETFEVTYPLEWMKKYEIIKKMQETDLGKKLLKAVRYCELGSSKKPCGECSSCITHDEAMYTAGRKKS